MTWRWSVPAVSGVLLVVALLTRGSGELEGTKAVRRSLASSSGSPTRLWTTTTEGSSDRAAVPGRLVDWAPVALAEAELLDEPARDARKEILREAFWRYRSAVACDDAVAERQVIPLLLLDRETALICAREEVAAAPTELDGELSRKAEQLLIQRIAESEVEESP